METITRNQACFSEVFRYAEEHFKTSWNSCCDVFHRTEFFNYEKDTDFVLSELEEDDAEHQRVKAEYERDIVFVTWDTKYLLAREIMISFMKHHKVQTCTITGA